MIAQVIHPDTGERFTMDIPNLRKEDLQQLTHEYTRDEQLKAHIERIPISAEKKVMLHSFFSKFMEFTVSVGETIIRAGKKILEIVIMLADKYKSATFGVIIAALVTLLIASIPLIGPPLAWFSSKFLLALGFTLGMWEDLKKDSPKLAVSIEEAAALFNPLNAKTAH